MNWLRGFVSSSMRNGPGCTQYLEYQGKDGSIAAALCVEAPDRKPVIGVLMPNGVRAGYRNGKAFS